MMKLPPRWHEKYLGIPWAGVPHYPDSLSCGELCRVALREQAGIATPVIQVPDAKVLKDCLKALRPELYGFEPVEGEPQNLDVAWLGRRTMIDHVGLGVETPDGIMVLHCQQGSCVGLDSLAAVRALGYSRVLWYRHREAPCLK